MTDLPETNLSHPTGLDLDDVKAHIKRFEDQDCPCDESHHLDLIHDIVIDDVPLLVAEVERLRAVRAAVRELLTRWEGPEGWTDFETNDRRWQSGYRTSWREGTEELRKVLNATEEAK